VPAMWPPRRAGRIPGLLLSRVHGWRNISRMSHALCGPRIRAIAPALFSREEFLTCVEEKDVEKSSYDTSRPMPRR